MLSKSPCPAFVRLWHYLKIKDNQAHRTYLFCILSCSTKYCLEVLLCNCWASILKNKTHSTSSSRNLRLSSWYQGPVNMFFFSMKCSSHYTGEKAQNISKWYTFCGWYLIVSSTVEIEKTTHAFLTTILILLLL